ncbi:MAG: hypothetical protein ACQCN4_07725 [Candidatus Bathyarchaeia archaeon]|jgi:hypothetical protein
MFEDFKEKIKERNREKPESSGLFPEVEAKLKEQGLDPATVTLDDMYPKELDKEGNDLSLMSGFELDIWVTFWKTRYYLAEKYPMPKEANPSEEQQVQADEVPQINIKKARDDPKSKVYLEALDKVVLIYGKIETLQAHASRFEKVCLRHYGYVTYNWAHARNVEKFRSHLTDTDIFEAVDAYFKICRKYHVPTLEEPYYFLSEQRRLDMKLEGDMLKRTGNYGENEIHVSILEEF